MSKCADISLKGITKTFGSVVANRKVNLEIYKGEIHALLGENGSGKSTLVNMLSGIYRPDEGEILISGKKIDFHSPKDAIINGIGMVHQHFKLVEVLSAKENIFAGSKEGFFIKAKELSNKIKATCEKYGFEIDPDKKVYEMSVSEKQTIEILKVLYRGADVLILDEPTAVLTPQECKKLFDVLRNMKNKGCAIIIITHKMNEVLEISDKVTVLRKGEAIATLDTSDTNAQELTEMMVGKAVSLEIERAQIDASLKRPLLTINSMTVNDNSKNQVLKKISFELCTGEVLGVAGIAGSGQKELCEAIAGLQKITSGDVRLNDESLLGLTPLEIIKRGISMSFVPEDRLGMGLIGSMNIIENVLLKSYKDKKGLFIDRRAGKELAEIIVEKYDINTPSVHHEVKKLSGGNIQKVLLGREIELQPQLLITAYPVRGLDIGASYNIYDLLNEQKKKGVGVLFIGEDLDVLLQLCDRIMVLHAGEISAIVDATSATKEQIGLMMLGHRIGEEVC